MKIGFGPRDGRRGGHRVLVVDDFPDAAEIVCTLLEMLGHDTRFALCGEEALSIAETFQPDIAVLDIGLPDISGYEVARELRRRFAGRALHLAAVTGWGAREDREQAYAAGFDQHVLKPTDMAKLRGIVRAAEQSRDRVGAAATAPA